MHPLLYLYPKPFSPSFAVSVTPLNLTDKSPTNYAHQKQLPPFLSLLRRTLLLPSPPISNHHQHTSLSLSLSPGSPAFLPPTKWNKTPITDLENSALLLHDDDDDDKDDSDVESDSHTFKEEDFQIEIAVLQENAIIGCLPTLQARIKCEQ
mmetsp:Transcript_44277/g.50995  ORF Transcript_44277/g.50995 Transcript_44277/m.50995 type:complete len:151 (+) Transcript_44277:99-551(+)